MAARAQTQYDSTVTAGDRVTLATGVRDIGDKAVRTYTSTGEYFAGAPKVYVVLSPLDFTVRGIVTAI